MKKFKFFIPVFILFAIVAIYGFASTTSSASPANTNVENSRTDLNDYTVLPDWVVYVHPDGGYGSVQYANVYIKLSGTNQFDSPKSTGSVGYAWFENNGSAFPDGYYEVRAVKDGFGDGVTYVTISGGSPVYPRTNVTMGPAY